MDIKKKILLIFLLLHSLLNSSCSSYIKFLKDKESIPLLVKEPTLNYCELEDYSRESILGTNAYGVQYFYDLLKKWKQRNLGLGLVEKGVLWSLFQMALNPALSSPTSRLQIVIGEGGEEFEYFDFYSLPPSAEDLQKKKSDVAITYPFLKTLQEVLKRYRSKYDLPGLSKLLDRELEETLPIDSNFSNFLSAHEGSIFSHIVFSKNYSRAKQILKQNESIPTLKTQDLVNDFLATKSSSKLYESKAPIFYYEVASPSRIACNIDLNLYRHSIYLIAPKEIQANAFGLKGKKGEVFLAVSSQSFTNFQKNLKDSYKSVPFPLKNGLSFVGNQADSRPVPICMISSGPKRPQLSLASLEGRDPGQYLFNLINDELFEALDLKSLDAKIKRARHLILTRPGRVLAESSRMEQEKIHQLLQLNVPVYHGDNLGNILAYFKHEGTHSFILDERHPGTMTCH